MLSAHGSELAKVLWFCTYECTLRKPLEVENILVGRTYPSNTTNLKLKAQYIANIFFHASLAEMKSFATFFMLRESVSPW